MMKRLIILVFAFCASYTAMAQSVTISEVNYKSSAPSLDCDDWFELYNYGTTAVNLTGWTMRDSLGQLTYTFPPYTLNANSYVVVLRKLAKFNAIYGMVPTNALYPFDFKINGFDSLILKDASGNTVCKAVVNSDKYWPDGADGEGRTMQLINENSNSNLMLNTSWRDGCMLGSPGTAASACNDPIIFTEINYNSDSTKDLGEFVELYNTTNAPIDLTNWYLKDGIDSIQNTFVFPGGTILQPGAYLLVSNDTTSLFKYKTKMPNMMGNFNFNLNNGGELIRLYNPSNILKFSMHYRDSIPWTDSADGKGYTLEIKSYTGRTNDPNNYFAGCKGGSPGMAYTPNCKPLIALGINDVFASNANLLSCHNGAELRFGNAAKNYQQYGVFDHCGNLMKKGILLTGNEVINASNWPRGIYVVNMWSKNGGQYTQKIILE